MDGVVGLPFAKHAPGGGRTLLHRVLPVLDSHSFLKHRMVVIGHVAGGIDARDIGCTILIHQDPVADLHAAAAGEVDDGFDPHSDDCEITIDPTTALRDDPLDPSLPFEAGHDIVEERFDAVLVVNSGNDLPHLLAEHAE